jgi:heme-NO-binding protein
MYGMVNNAIRSFVIERYGSEAWTEVCREAGIDRGEFAAVLPYDDQVSMEIIARSANVTRNSVPDLLHDIGRYWVGFAARSSFGPLIRFGGSRFDEFLGNLDLMHSKIKASLPELAPPSFHVEALEGDLVRVTYRSTRDGLFPFVEGLFEGLSDHFRQPVVIAGFESLGPAAACWTLRVGACGAEQPAA